ncbi:MAG: HAMP domain-containing sensor histidine kinase [Actinomycetota bacterium]
MTGPGETSMIATDLTAFVASATSATKSGMDMMEDGPSLLLFIGVVAGLAALSTAVLPALFRRLSLRTSVPGLAMVGPILGLVGAIVGIGAMTLSGREIWYTMFVAVAAAGASIFVGLKMALPVARDLERIGSTVKAVAGGDREVRTDLDRQDEVGALATAVDGLSRSLAMAEAEREMADQERTAVVSALSHDLRTPLASLLVSIDAIEDGIGESSAHLRAMRGNVLALEHLVEDLFLLARADSGSLGLNFESLDLAELVDDAVEALRPMAGRQATTIENSLDQPVLVDGDHTALGRVFRNLLDNAIRHSPADAVVSVSHRMIGDRIRVEVVDQGPGFPPEFVPRALDRFSQADDARTRQGAAGLGLAIADAMVKAHGGLIEVQAGPGGRVAVVLPVTSQPASVERDSGGRSPAVAPAESA